MRRGEIWWADLPIPIGLEKTFLMECIGMIPETLQEDVDHGLRSVLYL